MLVRPNLNMLVKSGTRMLWNVEKMEQIQRNSCRFIFHEYRRDTDTSLLISRLNPDSIYTRRLIQQANISYKIHCNLIDICLPSYIRHANHFSSKTDHPMKHCKNNPLKINAYEYSFFHRSMNIWSCLPSSAVSNLIPSVENFHTFAMPVIRVMHPLYCACVIYVIMLFMACMRCEISTFIKDNGVNLFLWQKHGLVLKVTKRKLLN